jgi:heterodisulfide reductase subunit B
MSGTAMATAPDRKTIPEDRLFLTPSCVLGAINPATEVLIGRLYDLLGLQWTAASDRPGSQCTCCTGILAHGDVISVESTLLVVARLWSIAAEMGFENVTTACVTSYAIHNECLEMYSHEPGLAERVDGWLHDACRRRLQLPRHVVHASEVIYHYRNALAARFVYRGLTEKKSRRPLRVVDHVGCHYAKAFPEKALGGAERCDLLTAMIRAWGGETVEYPERSHCCGMGFRQCMIRPNRGYTMACVLKKLESMEPYRPEVILTNCPGCNVMLDKEQWAIAELTGKAYDIPTLSYAELAGLLLGWDPYDVVGIQSHTVPVEPLLDKLGIPYDTSKEQRMP